MRCLHFALCWLHSAWTLSPHLSWLTDGLTGWRTDGLSLCLSDSCTMQSTSGWRTTCNCNSIAHPNNHQPPTTTHQTNRTPMLTANCKVYVCSLAFASRCTLGHCVTVYSTASSSSSLSSSSSFHGMSIECCIPRCSTDKRIALAEI